MHRTSRVFVFSLMGGLVALLGTAPDAAGDRPLDDASPGIHVLVEPIDAEAVLDLAANPSRIVCAVFADQGDVRAMREAAAERGLLGRSVYAYQADADRLPFADNLVDELVVLDRSLRSDAAWDEWQRVVRPLGAVIVGDDATRMPYPDGADDWTHPYHGPDNNPQSNDKIATAPYRTQFLAEPYYIPFPTVTVVSHGRLFKAMGHVAYKDRERPWMNTLIAMNAYNGTLLWKRPLEEGFNIHRNTMVATPETLYVADSRSCKRIDPATGELLGEITAPDDASGPVWKWMAIEDGVLHALVGEEEEADTPPRGGKTSAGWPWSPMTPMYDAPEHYRWGRGRTFFAMDLDTREVLWRKTLDVQVDNRAVCMRGGRIHAYSHGSFAFCLDARSGDELWRNATPRLLNAIGEHDRAQIYHRGFSTQSYVACDDTAVYFAGPQRTRLVAIAADDGHVLWDRPHGNYQLVLRDGVVYAMARTEPTGTSCVLDPATGRVLREITFLRGNCTRATGTADSIFCRGPEHGGTLRVALPGLEGERIALMRPPCMDGVIASGGVLHWGPWMCDCSLSLVGNVCLAPTTKQDSDAPPPSERLRRQPVKPLINRVQVREGDWPTYRGNNRRTCHAPVDIASEVELAWRYESPEGQDSTAPIACGGRVFLGGVDGVVRSFNAATGEPNWAAYTGGRIIYPPVVSGATIYVGSGDGCVYSLETMSGRRHWRYRVAPEERIIPVYGRLMSTWPVAGGVLVDGEDVYAAAGIANYDGVYVCKLDTRGRLAWENTTSGRLGGVNDSVGVSVQGHLLLDKDRLYLAGGNVVSPAAYDVATGECLSRPAEGWSAKAPRGRELFVVGDRVTAFDRLLYSPKDYWEGRYFSRPKLAQAESPTDCIRVVDNQVARIAKDDAAAPRPEPIWVRTDFAEAVAVALGRNAVVVAGRLKGEAGHAVVAFDLETGRDLWRLEIDNMPMDWGVAFDADGRVFVTLRNGDLLCLAPVE